MLTRTLLTTTAILTVSAFVTIIPAYAATVGGVNQGLPLPGVPVTPFTQTGNGNVASIEQINESSFPSNYDFIGGTQEGNRNTLSASQTSGTGINRLNASQAGNDNQTSVTQNYHGFFPDVNKVDVDVKGNANTVAIKQDGAGNKLNARVRHFFPHDNEPISTNNSLDLTQQGDGNIMNAATFGNNNRIKAAQSGLSNTMEYVENSGDNNSVLASQIGENNKARVNGGSSNSQVQFEQYGNFNDASVAVVGANSSINFSQYGNSNSSINLQIANNTTSTTSILGSGNNSSILSGSTRDLFSNMRSSIVIMGDNNGARITQGRLGYGDSERDMSASIEQIGNTNSAAINSFAYQDQGKITQHGNNNAAAIEQSGYDTYVVMLDKGVNVANILQQGGDNNSASVKQLGLWGITNVTQEGSNNSAIAWEGNTDFRTRQWDYSVSTNDVTIAQKGNGNTGGVWHSSVYATANAFTLEQTGDGNVAATDALTDATSKAVVVEAAYNNKDTIRQIGNRNITDMKILGGGNTANVAITGNDNKTKVRQAGSTEVAGIEVRGDFNEASLMQDGAENIASIHQDGMSNLASIQQVGMLNNVSISQFGTFNNANVLQTGNGNVMTVVQK